MESYAWGSEGYLDIKMESEKGGERRDEKREDGRNNLVIGLNQRKEDQCWKRRAGITTEIERTKVISENENEAPFDWKMSHCNTTPRLKQSRR